MAKGYRAFLTRPYNLEKMTFCADILIIFKRFQKQLQSDSLTLPMFCQIVRNTIDILNDLVTKHLVGGFEQTLSEQIEKRDDEKRYLKGIELQIEQDPKKKSIEIDELRKTIKCID